MSKIETEADRQDVRDAILDAAERLMVHYGYQKMTMQDLAQEAGIGVGTTYLHFKGKADVAHAVFERANERVLERLREIASSEAPVQERFRRMLVARVLLRYESARQAKHRLEEMIALIRPIMREGRAQWMEEEPRLFEQVLREGERGGVFAWDGVAKDHGEAVQTLLLATCGLMPDKLSPADFDDPSRVQAKAERLADLLVRALRPS